MENALYDQVIQEIIPEVLQNHQNETGIIDLEMSPSSLYNSVSCIDLVNQWN